LFENLALELKEAKLSIRKIINDYLYTIINPVNNEEVEVIDIQDFIKVLSTKYPEIFEDDFDFILEYVFIKPELKPYI